MIYYGISLCGTSFFGYKKQHKKIDRTKKEDNFQPQFPLSLHDSGLHQNKFVFKSFFEEEEEEEAILDC